MSDRPVIRCLVGKPLLSAAGEWTGEVVLMLSVVLLDEAAELQQNGYRILVDPSDEEALTRWEMIERSKGLE